MLKRIGAITAIVLLLNGCSQTLGPEFQPSGVNSHFTFDTSKPFEDYITYKKDIIKKGNLHYLAACLLYTSPSPRD